MTKQNMDHIQSIIRDTIAPELAYNLILFDDNVPPYDMVYLESKRATNAPADLKDKIVGALEGVPADTTSLDIYSTNDFIWITQKQKNGLMTEYKIRYGEATA